MQVKMAKSNEVQPSVFENAVAPFQFKQKIHSYFSTEAILEAEIYWVVKMTLSHFFPTPVWIWACCFLRCFLTVTLPKNLHLVQPKQYT